MLFTASLRTSFRLLVSVSLLALAPASRIAHAQTCGNPPTNVQVGLAVCTSTVRVTWTNPAGLVFPKVWRSPTTSFSQATLVFNPGPIGGNTYNDTPPSTGINYYYWVGGDIFGCGGNSGASAIPTVGPLKGGVFSLNGHPAVDVVPTCTGIRLSWQPASDVLTYSVIRVNGTNNSSVETVGTVVAPTTTFLDTSARPGNQYRYGVLPATVCGTATTTSGSNLVRAGPLTLAAASSITVSTGADATITVYNPIDPGSPVAIPAPSGYAWSRQGGGPLSDNAKYSGTNQTVLTIRSARVEDSGVYFLTAQTACGSSFTVPVVLAVTQPCPADFNQSGAVSVQDIFDYLTAFFSGCP